MSLDDGFPLPQADWPVLNPLWQGAASGELRMPRCQACSALTWYPGERCVRCGSESLVWQSLSGKARLFSWAVVRRALDPRLKAIEPYVSALVEIEEDPRVRLVTRLVDCEPAALRIDQPLQVCFRDFGYPKLVTGVMAPLFHPLIVGAG